MENQAHVTRTVGNPLGASGDSPDEIDLVLFLRAARVATIFDSDAPKAVARPRERPDVCAASRSVEN